MRKRENPQQSPADNIFFWQHPPPPRIVRKRPVVAHHKILVAGEHGMYSAIGGERAGNIIFFIQYHGLAVAFGNGNYAIFHINGFARQANDTLDKPLGCI